LEQVPHETVEGGDNTYSSIAAASILAKTARDEYILELCEQYPELKTRYGLDKNMGYGPKLHMDGIREHGISQWHRTTYGICKSTHVNVVS
jgi:ribonuclease HII